MARSVGAYLLFTNVTPREWQAPVWGYPQVIGRHPDCEIVIPGAYSHVSRQHALIGCRQDDLWIQDLGSSGGSSLNGVPLLPDSETRAVIGDRLSLAGLELYIVSPQASVLREASAAGSSGRKTTAMDLRLGGRRSIDSLNDVRLRCLSPAELEVVRWVCRGLTVIEEIGQRLFRSPHTVRTQLNSVYKKLDVHSREELLSWMRRCEVAWTKSEEGNEGKPQSPPLTTSNESLKPNSER